jgi:hypothetical protein
VALLMLLIQDTEGILLELDLPTLIESISKDSVEGFKYR